MAENARARGEQASGSPLAIVLGIVLDGIPESIVIGLTMLTGGPRRSSAGAKRVGRATTLGFGLALGLTALG